MNTAVIGAVNTGEGHTCHFTDLNNLTVDSCVIFATDDSFGLAENLLKSSIPKFKPCFSSKHKCVDGWETKNKSLPEYDWCIIQLAAPGVVYGFDVDTSFFTGTYSPKCSIQGVNIHSTFPSRISENKLGVIASKHETDEIHSLDSDDWSELVSVNKLKPGYRSTCHNYFPMKSGKCVTHIRLNMLPSGGIARLRVYGKFMPDFSKIPANMQIDLCAMQNGGVTVGYSHCASGHPKNLILPQNCVNISEGWQIESSEKESPVKGYEWAEWKLGAEGVIHTIEIGSSIFKENGANDSNISCYVEACYNPSSEFEASSECWKTLLKISKLVPNKQHIYTVNDIIKLGPVTNVRLYITPGVTLSRIKLYGCPRNQLLKPKL